VLVVGYGTTLLAPITSRRARAIAAGRTDLRLHLGSGANRLPGQVNIDLLGMGSDLAWDLRRRLPFPDACAQAAWLEHVIQEFPLADALALLEECHRVLRPGGTIRVGVPDLGRYIRSYTGDRELIEQVHPNRPTSLLAVAEVAQFHGNRSAYDAETLVMLLEGAGFVDVDSAWLQRVQDARTRSGSGGAASRDLVRRGYETLLETIRELEEPQHPLPVLVVQAGLHPAQCSRPAERQGLRRPEP
jgi:predicted SAM-dependent methyltransferase